MGSGCYVYRKRKMAADQLALVSAMEVGMPGAQPYQVGIKLFVDLHLHFMKLPAAFLYYR